MSQTKLNRLGCSTTTTLFRGIMRKGGGELWYSKLIWNSVLGPWTSEVLQPTLICHIICCLREERRAENTAAAFVLPGPLRVTRAVKLGAVWSRPASSFPEALQHGRVGSSARGNALQHIAPRQHPPCAAQWANDDECFRAWPLCQEKPFAVFSVILLLCHKRWERGAWSCVVLSPLGSAELSRCWRRWCADLCSNTSAALQRGAGSNARVNMLQAVHGHLKALR